MNGIIVCCALIFAGGYTSGLNIIPTENLDVVSNTKYDYIVVGGGAGGIPLAAALAEDRSLRILVLERGATRDEYPETRVGDWINRNHFTDFRWSVATHPLRI